MEKILAPRGRVIIRIDHEGKNSWTFRDGTKIRLERQFDNFNRRETEPVNAEVVDAENIPSGAEILIHHNAVHPTYAINNLGTLSGEVTGTTVKHYAIPEEECFLWRTPEMTEWKPCRNYATALRVFEPYRGVLEGIAHTKLKNTLYITSGELKGHVAKCAHASDYEIIYQGREGREERIIRIRHFENEDNIREEVICLLNELTEKVNRGELYVGLSAADCAPLNNPTHA
jgi:hypothetical protein